MNTKNKQSEPSARPIILEIEETKARVIQEINAAIRKGIPCYLLKDALDGVLSQMREGARRELEIARSKETKKEETE